MTVFRKIINNIFSITNEYQYNIKHKVICILGIKLKFKWEVNFLQQLFSVRNTYLRRRKVVRIFGCKISFKHNRKMNFKKYDEPLISIIIPVYNHYEMTVDCLETIRRTVKNIPYEIIIADDCSTDKTTEISKYIKNIVVAKTVKNSGFLRNCNNAAKVAKGEYIWLLNNDTIVLPNALKYLLKTFDMFDDCGAVGSKLLTENYVLSDSGSIVFKDATAWNYGRGGDSRAFDVNYLKTVDYCCGASLLLKRDLWNKLGGFDEYYAPAYYEETDLCFRIRELGLNVYYQPKSEIIHLETISMKTTMNELMDINKKKFFKRWEQVLKDNVANPSGNFFAKDRSYNKKIMLFCDFDLLRPDTNCGNRSAFQYLKLFKDMGFNVKYIAVHPQVREFCTFDKYEELLTQKGIEVIYSRSRYFKEFMINYGKYVDYLFINRPGVYMELVPIFDEYCKNAIRMYQGVDIHHLRMQRDNIVHNDKTNFEWLAMKYIEQSIWKSNDYILYYTDNEIEEVKKVNPQAKTISVPLYLFDTKPQNKEYNADERENLLFIGGYNHPPNRDAMVWFLGKIFPMILKKNKNIKINVAGSNVPPEIVKFESENVIIKGFVSDEELQKLYNETKIVVVPLLSGAGIKGKIIEALANKVPVITTDIGVEGIPNEENIIQVANSEKDFAKAVLNLYCDSKKLNSVSSKTEAFINKYFSKQIAVEKLKNILFNDAKNISSTQIATVESPDKVPVKLGIEEE